MPSLSGSQKAKMFAQAAVARAGATRSGYHSRKVFVSVNGVQVGDARAVAANKVLIKSLSITEVLNETPNTASFTTAGFDPTEGQAVIVTLGSINAVDRLFAGHILTRRHRYFETPAIWFADVNAIDDTWQLTRRRFSGSFTNVDPAVVAAAIIALVPGFTVSVESGLPTIDAISFTDVDCLAALSQLAKRVGGYCDVDYRGVAKLFTVDATAPNPRNLTSSHPSLREFSVEYDLSQVRTRVFVEGGGVNALAYCAVGETILPIETIAWYNRAPGGVIKSGPQHITYTDVFEGGGGSLVGPGASPSAAPSIDALAGTGLGSGVYRYAYTDVTALGESLPSPVAIVTTGVIAAPTIAPVLANVNNGFGYTVAGFNVGDTIEVGYTFSAATSGLSNDSAMGPTATLVLAAAPPAFPGAVGSVDLTFYTSSDRNVKKVRAYVRNVTTGGAYQDILASYITNNQTGFLYFIGNIFAGAIGAIGTLPTAHPEVQQATIAGIAIGPSSPAVTSRNVYRTVVNGSQLKLQQTIANNTATSGVTDTTADGSLGVNAPTSDTSGLTMTVPDGGGFYTSGVTFSTNGAATLATSASPVFASASYTFVAGDVGASVYIKSGANWTVGKYVIASVAAGAATLVGACASVASPTNATWGVDYTGLSTPRYTFSDLVIDGATSTKFTSAAFPVGVNFIGNVVQVQSSLGFVLQRAIVVSISGVIATCDKSLGALSSTGGAGTLGGQAPDAVVRSGATSLLMAGTGAFSATGGWAIQGQQSIRYTGISGNTLTGIPASGPGAITATINYGSPITAASALTGIPSSSTGSILYPIVPGDEVNLLVQCDDVAAQTALAALIGGSDDGIVEDSIQDRRLGDVEARARGNAQLAFCSVTRVTIRYKSRDAASHTGRTITVSLGSPTSVTGTFQIQHVTIDTFLPNTGPTFTIEASNSRFSLEDLLRLVRKAA